ncbi:MAG: type II toxin-antitoxin system VapC family toxin [Cyanobacteria bacterium J06621_8]
MRYLLDTDHFSVLQRQTGDSYINLSRRMAQYPPSDFGISIVTFHEQMLGSHAYINRANSLNEVVKGYGIMARIVSDFKGLPLISFDQSAATAYSDLEPRRIQLAKMDARIAAIAISRQLILISIQFI